MTGCLTNLKEVNGMNNSEKRNISSTILLRGNKNHSRSFIILSSFALFLDIFLIALTLRNKKLRSRPANKFLLNLFISDGIFCISLMSYAGNLLGIWDDGKTFFKNYLILQTPVTFIHVVVVLSMLNFTLITVYRLIAVKWPFFYEGRVHTKQSLIAIAVVWGIIISYAILMITLFNVLDPGTTRYLRNFIFLAVVVTGFITLFISNSFIFVEARSQLKAIEKITHSIENLSVEPGNKSNNKKEFRKKEFRLVRINIGLILFFLLFWINVFILFIKFLVYTDEVKKPIPSEYIIASWYLVHIYYICNPLWYVALNSDVKREVKQLFSGKKVEDSSNSSPMT